jgi:hypothetical protein
MEIDLTKMLRQAGRIRFRGGVVGKVCTVLTVSSICIAGLGIWSGNPWIMGGGILAIVAFAFPMLWKVINFADKNPQAALLEGAEFLVHQQIVLGTKQNPVLIVTPETFAEEPQSIPEAADPPMLPGDPEEVLQIGPAEEKVKVRTGGNE